MVIAMRWPGAALLVSTFSVPGSFGHCAGCSGDAEGPATTGSFAPLRVAGYQGMVARAGEAAGCIATASVILAAASGQGWSAGDPTLPRAPID
jgi:hypothetical protein